MELLLNLAWLLLALPAVWFWRGSRSASFGRKFSALQCFLALGCMLVILFPVVSATDDLRAMGNEMEESPASKRTIRIAGVGKISAWRSQSPPALFATATFSVVGNQEWQLSPGFGFAVPVPPATQRASRAPPSSPQL